VQSRLIGQDMGLLQAKATDAVLARGFRLPVPVKQNTNSDALEMLNDLNCGGRIEYSDYSALHDLISLAVPVEPEQDIRGRIADLLIRRADKEAPNAKEALRFMAGVVRSGDDLPESMLGAAPVEPEPERINLTYEIAKTLPLGTIVRDVEGYWANIRRAYVKTSDSTWAYFVGEVTHGQVLDVVEREVNNLSPCPSGLMEVTLPAAVPDHDPSVPVEHDEAISIVETFKASYNRNGATHKVLERVVAALREQSVAVPVEPEWEYGAGRPGNSKIDSSLIGSRKMSEANCSSNFGYKVYRRTAPIPAGPWIPVDPVQVDPSEVLDNE